MTRIVQLTASTRSAAPDCCTECVFWQQRGTGSDARAKERWAEGVERRFGAWGRILMEADGFRGVIQYGPARAFARARHMPAGPPGRDAALITCAFLDGNDLPGTCERLLLEALADLKARGLPAVEVFALRFPDEVPLHHRFDAHHTLFDRTFLQRFGFTAVRTHGQVSLMRLALGGLDPLPRGTVARLARRLRPTAAGGQGWPGLAMRGRC